MLLQIAISMIVVIILVDFSHEIYIKPVKENFNPTLSNVESRNIKDEWSVFKRKLGLTDQKVELLKSQKDKKATIELLNRFIKENPKYITVKAEKPKQTNPFFKTYYALLEELRTSKSTMKASLNLELADKAPKDLKRPRRKIAVKMVSDMPSEKIDDLLNMFNKQHGLNNHKADSTNSGDKPESNEIDDYGEFSLPVPLSAAVDPDYMYENLYEDEEDLDATAKSHHNSEYSSFQDLILQAKRNQWQREIEETKFTTHSNEYFV